MARGNAPRWPLLHLPHLVLLVLLLLLLLLVVVLLLLLVVVVVVVLLHLRMMLLLCLLLVVLLRGLVMVVMVVVLLLAGGRKGRACYAERVGRPSSPSPSPAPGMPPAYPWCATMLSALVRPRGSGEKECLPCGEWTAPTVEPSVEASPLSAPTVWPRGRGPLAPTTPSA